MHDPPDGTLSDCSGSQSDSSLPLRCPSYSLQCYSADTLDYIHNRYFDVATRLVNGTANCDSSFPAVKMVVISKHIKHTTLPWCKSDNYVSSSYPTVNSMWAAPAGDNYIEMEQNRLFCKTTMSQYICIMPHKALWRDDKSFISRCIVSCWQPLTLNVWLGKCSQEQPSTTDKLRCFWAGRGVKGWWRRWMGQVQWHVLCCGETGPKGLFVLACPAECVGMGQTCKWALNYSCWELRRAR